MTVSPHRSAVYVESPIKRLWLRCVKVNLINSRFLGFVSVGSDIG
jgi:hypothetical protein